MAKAHPKVSPMRELRSALSEMRLSDLAVGSDGRNRTILSAFRSRTGRYQPSNTKYIFGPSVWLRCLIKPPEGWGVAYLDWSQQELAIAAVLSGDEAMQAAYLSGDPYLEFAKQAGLGAGRRHQENPRRHARAVQAMRAGVAYGMEAKSLAQRIGKPEIVARDLLRAHRETYRQFWAWSDATVDRAMLLHPTEDRVRLADPNWQRSEPALAAQLSLPGQRRRDAAAWPPASPPSRASRSAP